MTTNPMDDSCRNLKHKGNELTVYFSSESRQSDEPCRFCGSEPACAPNINVKEILVDGYLEVAPADPLFAEVQELIRRKELHGKPVCDDQLCVEKEIHDLLGDETVYNMIATGQYVPNPD